MGVVKHGLSLSCMVFTSGLLLMACRTARLHLRFAVLPCQASIWIRLAVVIDSQAPCVVQYEKAARIALVLD